MCPQTCMCSLPLFLQISGCFNLFLIDDECSFRLELRYSEPKNLATIAQVQPMHEIHFQIPPASEFSFLVALQPQLFDRTKHLDALLTPLTDRNAKSGYVWKDALLPTTLVNSACLHLGMQVDLAMLCPLAMPSTPGRHAQSSARHKNPHAMIVYEMLNFYQVRNKKMQQKCSPTLHHKPTVTLLCSRCDRGHYYVWPTMSVWKVCVVPGKEIFPDVLQRLCPSCDVYSIFSPLF